jgi:UDP-glucose 4-epimerase
VEITDRAACVAATLAASPEVVIHLAALHFIPECNRRPDEAVRINVIGTENLLEACSQVPGLARVVITSSAAVYGISDSYMNEAAKPEPSDIYGTTKTVNEWQAREFAALTGISTVAVRLFNVFGPGETNPHVLPAIMDQLRARQRKLKLGSVSPKRCYVYIDDVVNGFETVARARLPETFTTMNLGTSEEASVGELIEMMSSMLKTKLEVVEDSSRLRPSDRPYLRCDPSLIKALTGWQPRHSIEAGLRQLLMSEQLL